jgi:hypothetical protein
MKQKLTLLNIVRLDKLTVAHLQKKFPHSMQSGSSLAFTYNYPERR